VAREAESAFGGLDILVNNAGSYPITSWWNTPAEVWLETYNSDVVAGVRLVKLLVPRHDRARLGPRDSDRQQGGDAGDGEFFPAVCEREGWAASHREQPCGRIGRNRRHFKCDQPRRGGDRNFQATLYRTGKKEGRSTDWDDVARWWIDHFMPGIPLGRMITPREVADVAVFLASPCADAITGSDFIVDGGLGITGFKRQPSQWHPHRNRDSVEPRGRQPRSSPSGCGQVLGIARPTDRLLGDRGGVPVRGLTRR
jgi:3-oxoacyl-[acyl-carrier protein] reductase